MMKKILLLLVSLILVTGCNDMMNTPGFKHLQNIKTVETIEKWLFFCQIFVFYLAYNTRTML